MNLLETLCQLPVCILVGQPKCAGNPPRQSFHSTVKSFPVNSLHQSWQQPVIRRFPGERSIQLFIHNDLNTVYKSIVSHTQISIIAVQGGQHFQFLTCHGDDIPCLYAGAGNLLAFKDQRQRVANHTALPRFQLFKNLRWQCGKSLIPVSLVQPHHLEGLPWPEREPKSDSNRIAVRPLVIKGKLHSGQFRYLCIIPQFLVLLRRKSR